MYDGLTALPGQAGAQVQDLVRHAVSYTASVRRLNQRTGDVKMFEENVQFMSVGVEQPNKRAVIGCRLAYSQH
jgi:hypothetical protein